MVECPVCREGCSNDLQLAIHLLNACFPIEREYGAMRSWRACWCGAGTLHGSIAGDQQFVVQHLRKNGGAMKHYADCLMGKLSFDTQ